MKKKIIIAVAILVALTVLFFIVGAVRATEPELECSECDMPTCEVGEKPECVVIEEAIPEVPTTYKCPEFGKAYKLHPVKECMIKVGVVEFYADKVVDVEGTPEIPAVYEWQCVTDPDYVAPEPEPEPEPTPAPAPAPAPRSRGGGWNIQARVKWLLEGSPAQVELANELMKEWHWLFPNPETPLQKLARQIQELQIKINQLMASMGK